MSQNSPQKWFNLEEHFFKDLDQQLLADLRNEKETADTANDIMQVTGIQDSELAGAMAELKVTVDTLAAFRLVPLVAVAWADDRVEENERYSIAKAAEKSGISADEPAMALLNSWTTRKPPRELLEAWCEYSAALCESLSEAHRATLKKEIMEQVHKVAEANGGVLGFGSVSDNEKELIGKVEAALG